MSKPVVYFEKIQGVEPPEKGYVTFITVFNHPAHKCGEMLRTSRVQNVFDDGSFETLNTIYRPAKSVTREFVDGKECVVTFSK